MNVQRRRQITCATLLFFVATFSAFAQTARFSGQVTDPQDAAIPGAQIQIINEDTFVKVEAKTDANGSYVIPYLPAGHYRIEVQAPGFNTSVHSGIPLRMGQAFIFNVQLVIGSTQSTVDVNASNEVTQVETDNAEVSGTITGQEVTGLQLNGRNFSQLIALAPGVSNQTSQDEARVGMAGSVSYSVNGGRVEYNSFQVDGSEILNAGINKDHTSLIVTPSVDAIQEIKVLTSNYGAMYPSSGNGTTLITTKSGTDKYHGNLYGFLRNEAFNAKGYFDVGDKAPKYRRNDFGGTIGGPLSIPHIYDNAKGRTHFFFSEEVRMETDPYAYRQGVPSLAERNGDFSDVCPYAAPGAYTSFDPYTGDHPDCAAYVRNGSDRTPPALTFPGNIMPSASPVATALLGNGLIPLPNATSGCTSSIGSCYLEEVSLPTFYREELVRVDHSLTSKEYLTFRYIHDEWNETAPVPQYATVQNSFPTIRNSFEGPGTSAVFRLSSQFGAKWTNEVAFSYTSSNVSLKDVAAPGVYLSRPSALDQSPADGGLGYIFNNAKYGKVPGITIGGTNAAYGGNGFSVDPGYMPWTHSNPDYSIMDNAGKIIGPHSLKFGVQFIFFNRSQTNGPSGAATGDVQGLMTFTGRVTGNSFADYLLMGAGTTTSGLGGMTSFQQDSGQGTYHQSYRIVEPYFQDDWKVTPRLTLNAGVRVSLFGVTKETHHNAYNWTAKTFTPALSESVYVGVNGQLMDTATNTATSIYQNGQVNPVVANGMVQCGVNGVPDGCMTGHRWNPAPRIGVAWDALGNGKMAVRAGYGIFFEHGTADEANTGSLEGGAPLVLSMTQYNVDGAGCIGFQAPGCRTANYQHATPGAFPASVTAIPTKAVWPYVQQWSLGIERELSRKMLGTFGYVGSKGTHLTLQREINQLIPTPAANNPFGLHEPLLQTVCYAGTGGDTSPGYHGNNYVLPSGVQVFSLSPAFVNLQTACYNARGDGANPNAYRTFAPGMGNIYSLENTANSSYNAFQFTLRRVAAPLTLGVAYTYSHSFDNSSDRSDANFVNSFDVRGNRASSNFDQRHLLHINYIYDLPLRSVLQRFLSYADSDSDPDNHTSAPAASSFLTAPIYKLLFDNWQLSGITLFETGIPFSVINGGSSNGVSVLDNAGVFNGVGAGSYPDICPNHSSHISSAGSSSTGVGPLLRNPAEFCAPRALTFGNAGRNVLRNPSRLNFDMALARHFILTEGLHLEFRAEAFNVFNHTQFRIYNPTLGNQANNTASCYGLTSYSAGDSGCLSNSSFLHPVDAHRPRTIQLGLKLDF